MQRVKQHNPWYGSSFFHAQSAVFDNVMRYVRIAVGYHGIYLFYINNDEVRACGWCVFALVVCVRADDNCLVDSCGRPGSQLMTELYPYSGISKWSIQEEGARFVFWPTQDPRVFTMLTSSVGS